MSTDPKNAVQQFHTATKSILERCKTMPERAARFAALGHGGHVDPFICGSGKRVELSLRDWISGRNKGRLDAVNRGEIAIPQTYEHAMQGRPTSRDPRTGIIANFQQNDIHAGVRKLEHW